MAPSSSFRVNHVWLPLYNIYIYIYMLYIYIYQDLPSPVVFGHPFTSKRLLNLHLEGPIVYIDAYSVCVCVLVGG